MPFNGISVTRFGCCTYNFGVTICRLELSETAAFSGIARIYEASISASERKPTGQLLDLCHRLDYRIDVATIQTTVAGFAVWFVPHDEPFALLEYLAVDQPFRSRGVGAALVRAEAQRAILAEVDTEDPAHPDAGRRVAFYRGLGFRRATGLDYLLPLRTLALPPAMHLFVRPSGHTPLSRKTLARWLDMIYQRVYGQAADDPRIGTMLSRVADPVELE